MEDDSGSSSDSEIVGESPIKEGHSCVVMPSSWRLLAVVDDRTKRSMLTFLDVHKRYVGYAQSMIVWRRPVALATLLGLVNAHFAIYWYLCLPFYSFAIAAALYGFAVIQLFPHVWPHVEEALFKDEICDGKKEDSNRMRSHVELVRFFVSVYEPFIFMRKVVVKVAGDMSLAGRILFLCIIFSAFLVTAFVDMFWVLVAAVNFVLITPGGILHPQVVHAAERAHTTLLKLASV